MLGKASRGIIKKFIADHRGEEITKHEGNFSSLVWGTACYAIYSPLMKEYFKGDFGSLLLVLGGRKGIGFFNFNNYKKSTKQALDKYFTVKRSFTELNDSKKIDILAASLFDQNYPGRSDTLTDKNLELLIIKVFELLEDWQVITLFCEALDEDIIKEYITKLKLKINVDEFIRISSLIDFKSFVLNQHEHLLRAVLAKSIDYRLQWIHASYLYAPEMKKIGRLTQQMLRQSDGLRKLKQDVEKMKKEIIHNRRLVNNYQLKLTGKTKDLFNFVKSAIYLRDIRKIGCYKLITILSNTAREIFMRHKLNPADIIYSTYEDFIKGTYRQDDYSDELRRRKKGFVIYFGRQGSKIEYVHFDAAKKELYRSMFGSSSGQKEITGNIANKGRVRGTVKIVLSKKDFSKFKHGEILVTSMTRPEFVPLIKKSAAIVTDEGGVTCHAAIVSRELDKPCIVGTKNATNFLHDGDYVDVDAGRGIVKVINP